MKKANLQPHDQPGGLDSHVLKRQRTSCREPQEQVTVAAKGPLLFQTEPRRNKEVRSSWQRTQGDVPKPKTLHFLASLAPG